MQKLGFGFMRLPLLDGKDQKSFDKEQLCQMVDLFLDRGFTYFDTAYMYHEGFSERVLKKVLVDRHERSSFTVATKMPTMMLKTEEDLTRIFNDQCEKVGVSYFDYYLLHCLTKDFYAIAERLHAFDFVMNLKKEGKIKHVGFSFHDNAKLLDEILTAHPEVEFVQLQINYLDWDSQNVQSRLCYEVARKHGKQIVVMEPVKGGMLANLPEGGKKILAQLHPDWSSPAYALKFAAGLPGVMMVLSGMSSLPQVQDNTVRMKDTAPLTEEEEKAVFKVRDLLNSMIAISCTACRYCVDGCPKKISIPDYFKLYNERMQNPDVEEGTSSEAYQTLASKGGRASECIGCLQCEQHCPQHIKITENLKKIASVFD